MPDINLSDYQKSPAGILTPDIIVRVPSGSSNNSVDDTDILLSANVFGESDDWDTESTNLSVATAGDYLIWVDTVFLSAKNPTQNTQYLTAVIEKTAGAVVLLDLFPGVTLLDGQNVNSSGAAVATLSASDTLSRRITYSGSSCNVNSFFLNIKKLA